MDIAENHATVALIVRVGADNDILPSWQGFANRLVGFASHEYRRTHGDRLEFFEVCR